MAKNVEISFAIGASLNGNFSGVFGKATQVLSQLQTQTSNLQKASGQISAYQKMQDSMTKTSEKLNAARAKVKELGLQMRNTAAPTKAMKKQFTAANVEANKLQKSLGDQRKKLNELRSELTGTGVDTRKLAAEQTRLTEQSEKAAEAQKRLQNAQARYAIAKNNLSWNNIKGELISSAAMAYTLYKPVKVAADFEAAMARVNAVAFSGAGRNKKQDAEDFALLQAQARKLGGDTQFTAVQAANTQENLARAGFKATEIISAMPGVLNMAAAEGMDLAQAADIAAGALRGFNLEADQMDRVSNVLAQTSAASKTNIAGLGEAMKNAAPVASQLGISIEQTAAMLGAMANGNIDSSTAGNAIKAAAQRLTQERKAVVNALKTLGVKATDKNGNLREIPELMQAISKATAGMGTAERMKHLGNIFGANYSAPLMVLMSEIEKGTVERLEFMNKASDGIMKEILEHVNKGVENSVVSFEEIQKGMKNSGYYAEKLGISFKDLSVDLALLTQAGIKGEKADRGLTVAFKQLKEQPAKVQKALKQFNISMKDGNGKLKDFPVLINEIKEHVMGLEQTKRLDLIEQIFGKGSGEAVQALMKTMTDKNLAGYQEAMKKAKSISSEMSDKNLDTIQGQLTLLGSAWEKFLTTIGNSLEPVVRPLIEGANDLLGLINKALEICPSLTTVIVDLFAAFAGYKILKSVYTLGKSVIDLFGAWRTLATTTAAANEALTTSQVGLNAAMSANPIGLTIAAIAALIGVGYLLYKNWDSIKELGTKMWDKIQAKVQWFSDYWAMLDLKNLFEPILKFANECIESLKDIWHTFADWLISLFDINLFGGLISSAPKPSAVSQYKTNTPEYHEDAIYGIPHFAAGGFVNNPTFSLIGEAGREVVIPLENKSRGIPLWQAAGEELGYSFGNTTNNNTKNNSVNLSPVFNFTINNSGDDAGLEARFRSIVEECLANLQNDLERVSFA